MWWQAAWSCAKEGRRDVSASHGSVPKRANQALDDMGVIVSRQRRREEHNRQQQTPKPKPAPCGKYKERTACRKKDKERPVR